VKFGELLWPFSILPVCYACIDTETTGLPNDKDMPDIVSLGITEVQDKKIVSNLEFKIRPHRRINVEAQSVHGITSEESDQFEELETQWPSINRLLSNRLVVIHNSSFDWPILLDQLARYGLSPPIVEGVFCSQKSAYPWAIANGLECTRRGPSLDVLTATFGVENLRARGGGLHGAAIDSQQTVLVVEKLLEQSNL
jgi:DNA polymerase-3 subunit epsilon